MAFIQYLTFDGTALPLPDSYEVQMDDVEADSGSRILLMDDVISTGGSLHAMEELVTMAGGTVTGRVAVLAEGKAADRTDIKYLAPLPLFNGDGTIKG